jgi:glycosyltransferase involved in cell wall biosynthesis
MKLSILIPSLASRSKQLDALVKSLGEYDEVECITYIDNGEKTIGEKRNWLVSKASGQYCAFIDDDDRVSSNYIRLLMFGINKGVDCCSLTGSYNVKGRQSKTFIHSIRYNDWFEDRGVLCRCPNHLNCIRTEIVREVPFPATSNGEDKVFSLGLRGLLKTEHFINETIYQYDYIPKVR